MVRILCVVLFATTSVLFGQLDSNSVTVTASRSVYSPPDQVMFSVVVSAPVNTTLDDIVAALQGSGITTINLSRSSASLSALDGGQMQWFFILPAPLANMKNTITSLTTLQQTIAQKNIGLKLTFNVEGTQISPVLGDSQQCAIADLVSDARMQAQQLAVAAGLTLGPILAIADAGSDSSGTRPPPLPFAGNIIPINRIFPSGTFIFLTGFFSPIAGPTIPAVTCGVTVKFTLLRYQ